MTNKDAVTPLFLKSRQIQLLLFGGKGGVGKTTCAAATALCLALNSPQSSFLLVSTDPAHSLADSLGDYIPAVNLKIFELNAQECLEDFKAINIQKFREIATRGTFLDEEDINQFLKLSLPGLDELMAFLEISRWVEERSYNTIIIDTAPTGHTFRLLAMPELMRNWLEALDTLLAKHRYMKKLFKGSYNKDELDTFLEQQAISLKKMENLLTDSVHCRFVPVMLPEKMSILETSELLNELERLRIPVTDIVVNKLYPSSNCPFCREGHLQQIKELADLSIKGYLSRYNLWGIPLYPLETRGPRGLEEFWEGVTSLKEAITVFPEILVDPVFRVESPPPLPSPETTLLLFAGKGGVGKTTLACSTALRLAQDLSGKEVLLFSTDPAHSLSDCLEVKIGPKPKRLSSGLTVIEIDAQAEFTSLKMQYKKELEQFLASFMPNLDLTFDHEVMDKIMDLSPPGLDEVMALTRVMDFLTQNRYEIFILDAAPTGHLIRLLELPELIDQWLKVFFGLFLKYKRIFRLPRISQRLVKMSKELKRLKTLLSDKTHSALYAVTIPTEMAYQETKDLVAACERIGVNVPVMFLNQMTPESECSLCSTIYQRESLVKKEYQQAFSGIHQTLVYRQGQPVGLKQLNGLGKTLYRAT